MALRGNAILAAIVSFFDVQCRLPTEATLQSEQASILFQTIRLYIVCGISVSALFMVAFDGWNDPATTAAYIVVQLIHASLLAVALEPHCRVDPLDTLVRLFGLRRRELRLQSAFLAQARRAAHSIDAQPPAAPSPRPERGERRRGSAPAGSRRPPPLAPGPGAPTRRGSRPPRAHPTARSRPAPPVRRARPLRARSPRCAGD